MRKKRFVVKIGSSSLTHGDGRLDPAKIIHYSSSIASLMAQGHQVILISSGAVAAGFKKLGYPTRPVSIAGKQASAAVGQTLLMEGYGHAFEKHSIVCAQLLLSRNDFFIEEQYKNAFNTLEELIKRKVLPIINENDSTSIEELTFGDNDMLSALVSGSIHADQLIIFTDIDGLYNDNPLLNPGAKKYTHLKGIEDHLFEEADSSTSKIGTGGMQSKVSAAKTAVSMGIDVFIGSGNESDALLNVINGLGNGTYISSTQAKPMNNKKQWLAFHSDSKGAITIDNGAEKALLYKGKSLLPVGIIRVEGDFVHHSVVDVKNMKGQKIGKGKCSYSAKELTLILEKDSTNPPLSGVAIHRDQWISFFT